MDMTLAEGQLKKAAEGFVKSMKQVYVNAKFQELQYGERNDGGKIAWLVYETMAIDADIFNIMFITSLEGKLLYGSFNCILGMQDEWKKLQCTVSGPLRGQRRSSMKAVRIETSPFQILSLVEFESILKKNQHGCAKVSGYICGTKRSADGYDIGRNMGTYLVL